MEYWKEVKLGDICEKIIDYRGKTPKKLGGDWTLSGYRALSAKNIKNGKIVQEETIKYLSKELYDKWMKDEVLRDDILITSEAPFGQVYYWNSDEKIVLSQRLFCIRINKSNYSKYIYYYMTTNKYQNELKNRATGTTVIGLRQPELLKTSIILPPLEEQKAIAKTLSCLDEKIELNNKINKNLEEMAQAIFKKWFIDFDYPLTEEEKAQGGRQFVDSELGKIPKGWNVGKLGDIIEFINGYAFKTKELTTYKTNNSYAIFKMGNIVKGGGLNSKIKSYIDKDKCFNLSKYILNKGDLLMCMTDMKNNMCLLGHTALINISDKYIVNQRVGLIRPKNHINISYPYLYLLTNNENFLKDLRSRANSGVQVNLSTMEIKNSKIIIPNNKLNSIFDFNIKPLFEKMFLNELENEKLTQIRDTLSPKLINGDIRVPF